MPFSFHFNFSKGMEGGVEEKERQRYYSLQEASHDHLGASLPEVPREGSIGHYHSIYYKVLCVSVLS